MSDRRSAIIVVDLDDPPTALDVEALKLAITNHERAHHGVTEPAGFEAECLVDIAARYDLTIGAGVVKGRPN